MEAQEDKEKRPLSPEEADGRRPSAPDPSRGARRKGEIKTERDCGEDFSAYLAYDYSGLN